MTPATISSGLVPNPPPSTLFVPPTRIDWDILFQLMFDELLTPSPSVDYPASEVVALIHEVVAPVPAVSTGLHSSTNVDQDAPSLSHSQTTPETQPPIIPNDVEEDNHDIEITHMGNDLYFGIPILEIPFDQYSSSDSIHIIVHPDPQIFEHNSKWTKDHPLENIIGELARPKYKGGFAQSCLDRSNVDELNVLNACCMGALHRHRQSYGYYFEVDLQMKARRTGRGYKDFLAVRSSHDGRLQMDCQTGFEWYFRGRVLSGFLKTLFVIRRKQRISSGTMDTPMVEKSKLDEDKEGKTVDLSHYQFRDADHDGCQDTRRSTSGSLQFLGDRLVGWSSKRQKSTAISSTEAEYIAIVSTGGHLHKVRSFTPETLKQLADEVDE
ncbi:integrase, catalytic region, zinc finger, CCHC-type containing protein [Tanacetum coccineum]